VFDEVDKSVGRWVNINQLLNNLLLGRAVFWGVNMCFFYVLFGKAWGVILKIVSEGFGDKG
jgi:hypothetical protein